MTFRFVSDRRCVALASALGLLLIIAAGTLEATRGATYRRQLAEVPQAGADAIVPVDEADASHLRELRSSMDALTGQLDPRSAVTDLIEQLHADMQRLNLKELSLTMATPRPVDVGQVVRIDLRLQGGFENQQQLVAAIAKYPQVVRSRQLTFTRDLAGASPAVRLDLSLDLLIAAGDPS